MGFLSQVWYYLIPLSCDAAPAPSLLVQEDFNEGLYVLVTQLGTSHGLNQLRGISQGIFKTSRLMYTHAPDVFVVSTEVTDIHSVLKYTE